MEVMLTDEVNLTFSPEFNNRSFDEEVPFWQVSMVMRIIFVFFILFPVSISLNGSVLITLLVTKSLHRPLNVVHISLTVELFFVKCLSLLLSVGLFPDAVRYCRCHITIIEIYLSLIAFNIVFVSVLFTTLSVMQFLVIKGKKRLIGWKVVSIAVTGSTIFSLILAILSFIGNKLQREPILCPLLCTDAPDSLFTNFSFSLIGLIVIVLLPCLIIIFITMLWTCLIFKKAYIGDNDQLNRRIVSLPAIMPLLTVFISISFFLVQRQLARILMRLVSSFFPNLVLVCTEFFGYFIEGISGFIYPIVLLYLHPHLRSAWYSTYKVARKVLFKKCICKDNRIHVQPQQSVSALESNSIRTKNIDELTIEYV